MAKKRQVLGRYIVADPEICHGKPIFRGTRIFVSDVLDMVAAGMAWETIIEQWNNSITEEAIAEAVKISREAFLKQAGEFYLEPGTA
jgi:uncharacterized protein (DUF433 family)